MAQIRQYAVNKLEDYFPNEGINLESSIYENTETLLQETGKRGMDFYEFRHEYKTKLQSLIQNLDKKDSNVKKIIKDILSTSDLNDTDKKTKLRNILWKSSKEWQPELWALDTEDDTRGDMKDDAELREGTFDCGNCARKGMYSRNTSHYEKQTRSADEPMTIFMHCHTCGKDYRFSS